MDSERIKISTIAFIFGVIVAFIFYPKPEQETIYSTKIERLTDTLYITSTDTIYVPKTKIKTEFLRDTILIDFKPQISRFETTFPFDYGSTKVSGEVIGEVLKMTATNDYNIPVVTNTIIETKTETIIKKPKGIYLGGGINSLMQPSGKIAYLDNRYLFTYQFQPIQRVHQIGVAKKLF